MLKNIYLICGKSGSGKTTVVNKLADKYGYQILKSYTTRKARHHNDNDHIYAAISDYMSARENNVIIASTIFDHNYYWATKLQLASCDLYIIDKNGIESLKRKYMGDRKIIVIYIEVNTEERIKRMKLRGDRSADIWERIKHDEEVFADIELISDLIVDGSEENTWISVGDIILQCESAVC